MWRHIFNINIALIFGFFFFLKKTLDIRYYSRYRTEEDDQSYLDFVGHHLCSRRKIEMKEDFTNSSGQLLDVDNLNIGYWNMVRLLICLFLFKLLTFFFIL
jgi:hypothetical protein